MSEKASLRDIMADTHRVVTLADYLAEQDVSSTAISRVIATAQQLRTVAAGIMEEFDASNMMHNPKSADRVKWEDAKATALAGLMKDLPLQLEAVAGNADVKWDADVTPAFVRHLKTAVTNIAASERVSGGTRNPGAYREDPFRNMNFEVPEGAVAASTGRPRA